ncbi:FAD-dependent oxidoreductase [bacterium]|nr:FAD-dependent oxidoreductase [bacterium]
MYKFLTDAQFQTEVDRCLFCEEMPCMDACPVSCSPAEFIKAVKNGLDSDIKRSATIILSKNILGGICGSVCPDFHCMAACSRETFDNPIKIPDVQAKIIQKSKELGFKAQFEQYESQKKKVGIIGGGPAGVGCANILAHYGFTVDIFEREDNLGGMCRFIPEYRLAKDVLNSDLETALHHENIRVYNKTNIVDLDKFAKMYDAVVISSGQDQAVKLNIHGKELAHDWKSFLSLDNLEPDAKCAIIGGGAVAMDCGMKAISSDAQTVDFFTLENLSEMRLDAKEQKELLNNNFGNYFRTIVKEIESDDDGLKLHCQRVRLKGREFDLAKIEKIPNTEFHSDFYDYIVFAVGSKVSLDNNFTNEKIFTCGDMKNSATTVVEAVASGRNCAVEIMEKFGIESKSEKFDKHTKSKIALRDIYKDQVSIKADFFGREMRSPFILSAAPPSDGYEQVKKAYEAGWAGAVMKTAFDDLDIHIPHDYMFEFNDETYANCDNVSEVPLRKVLENAHNIIREFPDRLTIVSTGGPVTGHDEEDKAVWQANTKLIDHAKVHGVEYSLSCPQGGDGTEGDIVSQNAELTAKVIDWVLEVSDPDIPKLFKLTGAVTSIVPILEAIKDTFNKYPNKKAGITLANSFPSVAFRKDTKKEWEDGIMVGMSGDAVKYISNLTLSKAWSVGLTISGNGGTMNYKDAADFLALGCKTVQFCTAVMKDGVKVIQDLEDGIAYLMIERKMKTINDLIGVALPEPILDFMDISPVKRISDVDSDLCEHCGNCTRCPYLAISLNDDKIPETDATKCIGCSICVQKCFSGALFMRERTKEEARN